MVRTKRRAFRIVALAFAGLVLAVLAWDPPAGLAKPAADAPEMLPLPVRPRPRLVGAPTPWPAVLPCAQLSRLWVHPATNVRWSSSDGKTSVRFRAAEVSVHRRPAGIRLGPRFPAQRVDRFTALLPARQRPHLAIVLECDDEGVLQIVWEARDGGPFAPTVTYPLGDAQLPRQGMDRWYRGPVKRFATAIAGARRTAAELRAPSIDMTRDLAVNFRSFVRVACADGKCSKLVAEGDAQVARFLAAHGPLSYKRHDAEPTEDELYPAGETTFCRAWLGNGGMCHTYFWSVTGDDVTLELGCSDLRDGGGYMCKLYWELPNGANFTYGDFAEAEQNLYLGRTRAEFAEGSVNVRTDFQRIRLEGVAVAIYESRR